jgi:hypothetical protein
VHNRRGGYCFGQNTLLEAALQALGFAVTRLAGRVVRGLPDPSEAGRVPNTALQERAIDKYEDALALWRVSLGEENHAVGQTQRALADVYYRRGNFPEATFLLQHSMQKNVLGADSTSIIASWRSLALVHR